MSVVVHALAPRADREGRQPEGHPQPERASRAWSSPCRRGTKYEEYLKALKAKIGFTLQSYPGDNDAVAQVLLGRADAVLTQDTSFAYQAKQHPGKIAIGFTFGAKRRVRDLLPQGRRPIGQQIDDGIAQLQFERHARRRSRRSTRSPSRDVK